MNCKVLLIFFMGIDSICIVASWELTSRLLKNTEPSFFNFVLISKYLHSFETCFIFGYVCSNIRYASMWIFNKLYVHVSLSSKNTCSVILIYAFLRCFPGEYYFSASHCCVLCFVIIFNRYTSCFDKFPSGICFKIFHFCYCFKHFVMTFLAWSLSSKELPSSGSLARITLSLGGFGYLKRQEPFFLQ